MQRLWVLSLFLLVLPHCWAQQCPQAPVLAPSHGLNLFTEEQEVEFGDIIADQLVASLHVIEDEEVAGYIQRIADRLRQQMPPTKLHFQVSIIDAPYNNAFTIPGGRIFVTKKMVAFVRSEDELAGVLGHEMGHQVTHQLALDWSRILHEMLGVTKLGDRADMENRYHQFLDIYRTKEGLLNSRDREEREQIGADQVAVYSLARVGYSPQAVVDFWDRFAETKGKKGSWLSDFFGSTRPEAKRLREFTKSLGALPASCVESSAHPSVAEFGRWQAIVKNYSGFGKKENLRNIVKRTPLQPPLRGDLSHLRFSSDGKYLLAQDDASIFVMSREPLANLFRIDAHDAYPAQFSPDSSSVVFYNPGLRVERWGISDRRMEDANDIHVFRDCIQSALSPDGAVLACIMPNRDTYFPLDLSLLDVSTGEPILTKKSFIGPATAGYYNYLSYLLLQAGHPAMVMAFSPDAHYFLAGRTETHLMVDLTTRSEVSMPGELKKFTAYNFAFVGPDRIVGVDQVSGEHGAIVQVPSGKMLESDIPIGPITLHPAAKGDYAIVRPLLKAPIGIMDLKAKRVFLASKSDALDIYDGQYVSERVNGEIGLYVSGAQKPVATLALPRGPLARIYSVAVSSDIKTFAVSDRARGAVWDVASGERLFHIRGFRGALFGADSLYVDFIGPETFAPLQMKGEKEKDVRKREAEKPGHSLARLDLAGRTISETVGFLQSNRLDQAGSVLLVATPEDEEQPQKKVNVEARDLRTGAVLWSRRFPKTMPSISGNNAEDLAVFSWYLGASGIKDELRDDPDAKKLVDDVKETEGSYFMEVLNARTGKPLGKFPVETGRASFRMQSVYAGSGLVVLSDNQDRVLLYSYTGEKKGKLFGRRPALSNDARLLCVEREPGRLILYDLPSLQKRDQLTFGSRVVFADFSDDSKRLVVLTDDQTLFVLDVSSTQTSQSVPSKN